MKNGDSKGNEWKEANCQLKLAKKQTFEPNDELLGNFEEKCRRGETGRKAERYTFHVILMQNNNFADAHPSQKGKSKGSTEQHTRQKRIKRGEMQRKMVFVSWADKVKWKI